MLALIHDRMPVIVGREDWKEWLSSGELTDESFRRIMVPNSVAEMDVIPANRETNSARVDDPRCSEPLRYPE